MQHAGLAIDVGNGVPKGAMASPPIEQLAPGSWADHAAAAQAWEREHEVEWTRVDQKLRSIAARRAALDAEEANLLRYAEELKLWRGWGFGSMLECVTRRRRIPMT